MKSKKLRNHLKWLQQHTHPSCSDTLYRSDNGDTLVHIYYASAQTFMWEVVMYAVETSGDVSDVESRYKLDATNTAKLMRLMAAHDGSSLLNAIKTRFSQYHADAHGHLAQYCDSHDIIYKETVY